MDPDFLLNAFAILVVTIDPIALGPIFLGVTAGMAAKERRQVALVAVLISFAVLTGFTLGGRALLDTLGISLPAFRIAGGLLLLAIGFEMVFELRQQRKVQTADRAVTRDRIQNVAVFPLAIPLIAGPGSITAVMLLASGAHGDALLIGGVVGVVAAVLALSFVMAVLATSIDKYLGQTARLLLSRLLGVILTALAVQFVIDGIKAVLAA